MKRHQAGVTLIELVVVILIVGILGAVAIPSYRAYALRTNRTDAKVALTSIAAGMERCLTRFSRYDHPGCTVRASLPEEVASGLYDIRLIADDATKDTEFVLQAVPLKNQVDDTQCGTFTLDQGNARGVTGSFKDTPEKCWKR